MRVTIISRPFISLCLLYSSLIFTSQLPEDSPLIELNVLTATGRSLAEQHAWYLYHHKNGTIPEISPNQLGQDDIRHPNTPVPDDNYDSVYVDVETLRQAQENLKIPPCPCITICSSNYGSKTIQSRLWIPLKYIPQSLVFARGSKQNPHTVED